MKKLLLFTFCLSILYHCKDEEKQESPYKEYYQLDIGVETEKKYSPKRKATLPFLHNKIYDPFLKKDSIHTVKSVFEEGKHNKLKIVVLDTTKTQINVAGRKRTKNWVSGIPVIIKNKAIKNTNHLLLHRGCALMIQEAKDKNGKWKEIEHLTKEKIGKFYYKILPKEYIYTKIPRYKGTFKTTFRVKLKLDDKEFIYSNEYKGMIQPWMVR